MQNLFRHDVRHFQVLHFQRPQNAKAAQSISISYSCFLSLDDVLSQKNALDICADVAGSQ